MSGLTLESDVVLDLETIVIEKLVFSAGSSKLGKAMRACVGSNMVTARTSLAPIADVLVKEYGDHA